MGYWYHVTGYHVQESKIEKQERWGKEGHEDQE